MAWYSEFLKSAKTGFGLIKKKEGMTAHPLGRDYPSYTGLKSPTDAERAAFDKNQVQQLPPSQYDKIPAGRDSQQEQQYGFIPGRDKQQDQQYGFIPGRDKQQDQQDAQTKVKKHAFDSPELRNIIDRNRGQQDPNYGALPGDPNTHTAKNTGSGRGSVDAQTDQPKKVVDKHHQNLPTQEQIEQMSKGTSVKPSATPTGYTSATTGRGR